MAPAVPLSYSRDRLIQNSCEGFMLPNLEQKADVTSFAVGHPICGVVVSPKSEFFQIDCNEVRRLLSDYLEDDLRGEMRREIEDHLLGCRRCTAVCSGVRNVVQLLGDERFIDLPLGFSERLYRRLLQ